MKRVLKILTAVITHFKINFNWYINLIINVSPYVILFINVLPSTSLTSCITKNAFSSSW